MTTEIKVGDQVLCRGSSKPGVVLDDDPCCSYRQYLIDFGKETRWICGRDLTRTP